MTSWTLKGLIGRLIGEFCRQDQELWIVGFDCRLGLLSPPSSFPQKNPTEKEKGFLDGICTSLLVFFYFWFMLSLYLRALSLFTRPSAFNHITSPDRIPQSVSNYEQRNQHTHTRKPWIGNGEYMEGGGWKGSGTGRRKII